MSFNHPYRKPQDDYTSHNMYPDSQRMYTRESGAYRSRIGTTSPGLTHSALSLSSEELSAIPPGKALSFLQSCGLDAGDLKTLAELPEDLISAEKLPELLAEIKKKKVSNMSRSGTFQHSTSGHSWEDRRQTQSVEYSLDLPVRQPYSHQRDQGQTLEGRWGNVQPASSSTHTYNSSDSNYVVDYNHLKEKETFFDRTSTSYATEPSRQKAAVASESYSNYGGDVIEPTYLSSREIGRASQPSGRVAGQPSHLSKRDVGQPSYLSSRDVAQPSYLSGRNVTQPSYLSSRDGRQSSHLSSGDFGQPLHLPSKDVGQSSHLASRDVGQPSHLASRDVGQPSYLSNRQVGQSSQMSSRDVSLPSYLSSRDVGQPSYLATRNVGQPSYVASRDVLQPSSLIGRAVGQLSHLSSRNVGQDSHLSSRNIAQPLHLPSKGQPYLSSRDSSRSSHQSSRNSQPSHLSGRGSGQQSHQRKTQGHKVPTRKEASDFHGRTPPVFPYACVLCEITVLSNKDWSVHINGPQHANSQLSLVERYPDWDQRIQSARRNDPLPERPQSTIKKEQGETSSSKNGSSSRRSGVSNSKSSNNLNKSEVNEKCKVVCVKFEVDEVNEAYLKPLLGQFGAIVKLIMLPRMAFVEMGSADQAGDIVKYFLHNPLRIKGKLLEFSLSSSCSMVQSSCVVSFMPLPTGEGVSSELTAIAKRFGSVKHSLFLPSRGYVEMSSAQEANKLVEHYSTNSLKLKGKTIQVTFSAEYQKLGLEREEPVSRSSNLRRRSRSRRRSHRDSPSPKRRCSRERSRSCRSSDSRKREERHSSKDKSRERSRRDDSRSRSRKSSSKDQTKISNDNAVKKTDDKMEQSTMCDDSDLEGVAVIADDCEELNSEDEFIEIDEEVDLADDEEQDSSVVLDELDDCDGIQGMKESDDVPSVVSSESRTSANVSDGSSECKGTTELQENKEEIKVEPVVISDGSSKCKEAKELQQNQGLKKETVDKPDGSQECNEAKELPGTVENLDGLMKCKEAKEMEENQEIQEDNTVKVSGGTSECQEPKELQQEQEVQKNNAEEMEQDASDVPVDLENCITLDEFTEEMREDAQEISVQRTEEDYGRVLEVKGFPMAKKYSEDDLLNIGKKCGEVAGCCLVRTSRKVEKALIEMVNASDASKLEAQSKGQGLKLGGKVLRLTVSTKYSEILKRSSIESESGKPEGETHVEENNNLDMLGEEINEDVMHVEEKSEDVMHLEKKEEAMHVAKTNEGFMHVEEKNEECMHVGEKNEECMHVEEKNEECMHVEEKNEVRQAEEKNEIRQAEEKNEVRHAEEKNKVRHVEENNQVMRVEEKNEVMHVEEKNKVTASCEEISEMQAETQTSEERDKALNEANVDTSSDEEEDYGKVLRVRNLPFTDEYTDADFVNIVERYGKVRRHWLFRPDHMGLIEMENASDAQKVVAAANNNEIAVSGKHPKITVSMKHSHLNKRYFQQATTDLGNEKNQFNTQNIKETSNDNKGVNTEDVQVEREETTDINKLLDDALGTEFIRPVVGYFCNLCNVIYASEEEAKNEHCRTVLHHQKHKERMEQNSPFQK